MIATLPHWSIVVGLAVLGAIWGSFVAALCARWPKGESILLGRSRCDTCDTTLNARELVPILSFLVQKGQCRHCASPIGTDSIGTELVCAGLGAVAAVLLPLPLALAFAALAWLLVPLIWLDWRYYWLPDPLVVVLAVSGLAIGGSLPLEPSLSDRLVGGAAGYLVLQALRMVYFRLRHIEAMGAADPKLFGAIGLWLGWQALPVIALLASVLGLLHFATRPKADAAVSGKFPFGSYLGLSTLIHMCGTALYPDTFLSAPLL